MGSFLIRFNKDNAMDRRNALRILGWGGLGLGAIGLSQFGCSSQRRKKSNEPHTTSSLDAKQVVQKSTGDFSWSPIHRNITLDQGQIFSGDESERIHSVFLDKRNYLQNRRKTAQHINQRHSVVIIGGGMSGLICSYLLKDYRPLLLEQASRLGGNSKAESWNGLEYSIGAAYYAKPEIHSALDILLKEIGIQKIQKEFKSEHPVFFQNQLIRNFWSGTSLQKKNAQFQILFQHFKDILKNESGYAFPEIPTKNTDIREYVNSLDRISFHQHLEKLVDYELHPHIDALIDTYCRSNFAANSREVSAAAGLNFYASEFGTLCVTPGGNAAIAEKLIQSSLLPLSHYRTSSVVLDVKVKRDGVEILFENANREVFTVVTKAAILTCPKFIVPYLINDLEPKRLTIIKTLKYRAYLVANILLKAKVPMREKIYSIFQLNSQRRPPTQEGMTDIVFANFGQVGFENSVLTLYWPIPYDGGRKKLLRPDSYSYYYQFFQKLITDSIIPFLKINPSEVADLRITRWGHALPLSAPGLIANRTIDEIRAPFRERVFFVNQDNWMLPALETCVSEALETTSLLRKVLTRTHAK